MPPQPIESFASTGIKTCPWYEPLCNVTPLSKYLAFTIFITLPFIGGYVGYKLAGERVVEVPVTNTSKQSSIPDTSEQAPSQILTSVPADAQHVLYDGGKTGYFVVNGQMYYATATMTSENGIVVSGSAALLTKVDLASKEIFGRDGAFLISDKGIYYGTEYIPGGLKKDTEIYWKKDTMDAYQIFVHDTVKDTWVTNGTDNGEGVRVASTIEKPDLATLTAPATFPSELTNNHQICTSQWLYGFMYYVSNVVSAQVCYGDLIMKVADAQSLMPLDSESPNYLIDVVVPANTSHYAFDKNNFYADGQVLYSVSKKNFALIKTVSGFEDRGQVSINGKTYLFGHTGLVGVTLLPNK